MCLCRPLPVLRDQFWGVSWHGSRHISSCSTWTACVIAWLRLLLDMTDSILLSTTFYNFSDCLRSIPSASYILSYSPSAWLTLTSINFRVKPWCHPGTYSCLPPAKWYHVWEKGKGLKQSQPQKRWTRDIKEKDEGLAESRYNQKQKEVSRK